MNSETVRDDADEQNADVVQEENTPSNAPVAEPTMQDVGGIDPVSLGSKDVADFVAQTVGTVDDVVTGLQEIGRQEGPSPAGDILEVQNAKRVDYAPKKTESTENHFAAEKKEKYYGAPYEPSYVEFAQAVVKRDFDGIVNGYEDDLAKSANSKDGTVNGVPRRQYATFLAWRRGLVDVDEKNAPAVCSALTSVLSNGAIQNDYDGSIFMSFRKRTDERTHTFAKGQTVTSDLAGENAKIKWSLKATLDSYKGAFDAAEAGKVGMERFTNENLLAKDVGLGKNENYFQLPHERQMEIVNNLVPYYADMTKLKNSIASAMGKLGRDPMIDCKATDAGQYISKKILTNGDVSTLPSWQQGFVKGFLESGLPRTEENLAEWLDRNKDAMDAEHQKWLGTPEATNGLAAYADPGMGVGTSAMRIADSFHADTLSFRRGDDGKYALTYEFGGKTDAEFRLKDKVISDIADADGRYTALRAINTLNAHPEAWSFIPRFVSTMNGTYEGNPSAEYKGYIDPTTGAFVDLGEANNGVLTTVDGVSDTGANGINGQRLLGDQEGAFTMIMDYLYAKGGSDAAFEVAKSAMEAFSCIDKRTGFYGENFAERVAAGTANSLAGGVKDFLGSCATWVGKKTGFVKSADDYAAEWVAKHETSDQSLWKLRAKHLYEGIALANENSYFSDNTVIGSAFEFWANLKAMGALFGASTMAVGGAVAGIGKGAEAGAKLMSEASRVGKAVGKFGEAAKGLGKWLATPAGLSPHQQKAYDSIEKISKARAELMRSRFVMTPDVKMRPEAFDAAIADCDKLINNIVGDIGAFQTASERIASFLAKLPAGGYFYDGTKSALEGQYVMEADNLDADTLDRNAWYASARGAVEGFLMAGITHIAQGATTSKSVYKMLAPEAREIDMMAKSYIEGVVIPEGKDVMKPLLWRGLFERAFMSAAKAFEQNAKFMFTMEESKLLLDNAKRVEDMKARDPNYVPTVYDYALRGQEEPIAETATVASTSAFLALGGGFVEGVKRGVLSRDQMEELASSRAGLAVRKIAGDETALMADAAKRVQLYLYDYATGDKAKRRDIREAARQEYGEEVARLLDQASYEVERARTMWGAERKGRFSLVEDIAKSQKITPDILQKSLSLMGATEAKCEGMPDGSVRVTMAKGTKIGDYTLDADRSVVVKMHSLKPLNRSVDANGKVVYDPNWCDEVVGKYESGQLAGTEFAKKMDAFLKRQMSDGQRAKKLAKLRAGENIEGLLDVATEDPSLQSPGIYIPKGDYRFGKEVGDGDTDLIDGIIVLADVNEYGKTPRSGLGAIEDMANQKGASVGTFLHEYFHAITDMLPIGKEEAARLQAQCDARRAALGLGRMDWKEDVVDQFLDWHNEMDAKTRAQKFYALSQQGGVLNTISKGARRLVEAFGWKSKTEDTDADAGAKRWLDDFIGAMMEQAQGGETKEAKEAKERVSKTKREILGDAAKGNFSVVSKEEMTQRMLKILGGSAYREGGFGVNPEDNLRVELLADNWMHGDCDIGRYPKGVFGGFDRKRDGTLARSIIVTSINATNMAETDSGRAKMSTLFMNAGLNGLQARNFVIERKGKVVQGFNGFDPDTCIIWGQNGYVKLDEGARDALMLQARSMQEANLRAWAKDADVWFDGIDKVSKELGYKFDRELDGGLESRVWLDAKHGKVVKHLWNMDVSANGDINRTLDRVVLFNSVFPEAAMKVVGWGEVDGKFGAFIEQPYVVGDTEVSDKEIDRFMKGRGFKRIEDPEFGGGLAYVSKDGSTVVRDLNKGGVFKNIDGSLEVIDAICALNTKQNELDGVVPLESKGFKGGTYRASWDIVENKPDESVLEQLRRVDKDFDKAVDPNNWKTGEKAYFLGFHGTPQAGFTKFDPKFSDDGLTLFAAQDWNVSRSYIRNMPDSKVAYGYSEFVDSAKPLSLAETVKKLRNNIRIRDDKTSMLFGNGHTVKSVGDYALIDIIDRLGSKQHKGTETFAEYISELSEKAALGALFARRLEYDRIEKEISDSEFSLEGAFSLDATAEEMKAAEEALENAQAKRRAKKERLKELQGAVAEDEWFAVAGELSAINSLAFEILSECKFVNRDTAEILTERYDQNELPEIFRGANAWAKEYYSPYVQHLANLLYLLDNNWMPLARKGAPKKASVYTLCVRLDNPLVVDSTIITTRYDPDTRTYPTVRKTPGYWNHIPFTVDNPRDANLLKNITGKVPQEEVDADGKVKFKFYIKTRELSTFAYEKGYDGVIVKNVVDYGSHVKVEQGSNICMAFDGSRIKFTDPITYDDDGKPITERFLWGHANGEVTEKQKDARWNVIGQRAFSELLGTEYGGVAAGIVRDEFAKALKAIESDEARDQRLRVRNDEINKFLESKKSNTLDVQFDGKTVPIRFYKGGADSNVRYEYGGTTALIPRNFKKAVTELDKEGKQPETYLTIADFYKKDPFLNATAVKKMREKSGLKGVSDAFVFVKGTPVWETYAANRRRLGQMNVEPLFVNGVGVNGYGDVVIERMADNRTIGRKVNMGVVKLMQKFERWETPVDADASFLRKADVGGKGDEGFNFGVNSERLKAFVMQAVGDRLEELGQYRDYMAKFNHVGANSGLGWDFEQTKADVAEAITKTISECAEYFNSEIEARELGGRFGVDVSKLPEYSEFQKAVVDGLIKPYNHNGLTSQMNTANVVKFYRDVVMSAVSKLVPHGTDAESHRNNKRNLQVSFVKSVTDLYRKLLADYISNMGVVEESRVAHEEANRFVAKDYKAGMARGEGVEHVVAENDAVAEKVERALDKQAWTSEGMRLCREVLAEAVKNGTDPQKAIMDPELTKRIYDSIIDAMRKDGGDLAVDPIFAKQLHRKVLVDACAKVLQIAQAGGDAKTIADIISGANKADAVVIEGGASANWSVGNYGDTGNNYLNLLLQKGTADLLETALYGEKHLRKRNARLLLRLKNEHQEVRDLQSDLRKAGRIKDKAVKRANDLGAKLLSQESMYETRIGNLKERIEDLKDKNSEVSKERRALSKRVANADAARLKAIRIRNAEGMTPAEVTEAFHGRDMIGELAKFGIDPNAAEINAGKFANELALNFTFEWRERFPHEFGSMSISEFFDNPIVAADFAATVASWLKVAARTCAYGRVRSAAERDAAALRHLVKPNFLTVKSILNENVRKMVQLRSRMQADALISSIRAVIAKRAKANKAPVEEKQAFERDIDPLSQEYWKQVGDCLDMTPERVEEEIKAIKNQYGLTDDELSIVQTGKGAEGLDPLTKDEIRDRRKALLRIAALSRYGAMKFKPLGELGDKIDEISEDIETHRERFQQMFAERIRQDEEDVNALVSELAASRGKTTGGANLAITRSRSWWRAALYHNVPDLFLRLKMMFPQGSKAYEICEKFRRDMSLAHLNQEVMLEKLNKQFMETVCEIYGNGDFGAIMTEMMTPHEEWGRFSRADWSAPSEENGGVKEVVEVNGKKHTITRAKMGADLNLVKNAKGLSKAQLIYIYAACSQGDMAVNNIVYGRDANYFREIAEIIGPEGIQLVKWMREQFELQRQAMSPISEKMTGMPVVAPTLDYFPLKFTQSKNDPLDKTSRYGLDLFPSFLKTRDSHNAAHLEEGLDVFHMFSDRMASAAHYISFMPIIDRVKTTFSDSRVQTAYANTIGNHAYKEMYAQLSDALSGGKLENWKSITGLRNFATSSTLFYNIPSALKQLEGIGGWSAEQGVLHWLGDMACFRFGTGAAKDKAFDIGDVILTRKNEGFSDVVRALKESVDMVESGGGTMRRAYNAYKKHGLTLTSMIDCLASRAMAGSYWNQKFAHYRELGYGIEDARRMALADVDYAIQTTQQSSRPEFQNMAQRNEFGKWLTQFAGPKFVRVGMELEALHRYLTTSGKNGATPEQVKEARRAFVNKAVALHVICPTILTALELLGKALTHNDDDDDFVVEAGKAWARNVLTGPFSGMFVFGSLLESGAEFLLTGKRNYDLLRNGQSIPLLSKIFSVANKTEKFCEELLPACRGELDMDDLLTATIEVFDSLVPAEKHLRNTIRNVGEAIEK